MTQRRNVEPLGFTYRGSERRGGYARCVTWCGEPGCVGPKKCRGCHRAYMREWRKYNRLSGEARRRANARSYAHVYLKRGRIQRQPCEVCGGTAQMHHDDYSKPTQVRWLCRKHHLELHK